MKTVSFFVLLAIIRSQAVEIIEASPDTLIVAGDRLDLNCNVEGEYDFCEWSYSDAWQCMTYNNAFGEELPCDDEERALITGTEESCMVGVFITSIFHLLVF